MKPIEKLNDNDVFMNILSNESAHLSKINEIIDAVNELIPKDLDCKQGGHDKCYSMLAVVTYPSQRDWICRICGKRGVDVDTYINIYEYDELVKRFKEDK